MNVFNFFQTINDEEIKSLFNQMIESDDLDDRMNICNEIISYLWYLEDEEEQHYPEGLVLPDDFSWDDFQDKLKDICIG